jgi:hypothetical protein
MVVGPFPGKTSRARTERTVALRHWEIAAELDISMPIVAQILREPEHVCGSRGSADSATTP